jgi:preprotein translocase subunit SecA
MRELAQWAQDKFGVTVTPEEMLADAGRGIGRPAAEIVELIEKRARDAYALRDLEYPVDQVLSFAFGDTGITDNPYAAEFVRTWVMNKYRIDLPLEHIRTTPIRKLRDELIGYQEEFLEDGRIEKEVDQLLAQQASSPADLAREATKRFTMQAPPIFYGVRVTAEEIEQAAAPQVDERANGNPPRASANGAGVRELVISRAKTYLRYELAQLEQFVLIQIFDQSWKDHLYAMDMLKTGIGLQAFAERDPRVAYKKEGYRYFQEMMAGVRDKVTDLIFRARVVGPMEQRSAYNVSAATHETSQSYGVSENLRETGGGGGEMAEAASQAQGEGAKVKTITRDAPRVGRNDPCPCGSGKKYKKCCGAQAA